jgi:DNA-binding GntR family transcriptional regulator
MARQKTSVQVERELKERILRQEYLPGTQLREEHLAAEMGATRNSVRTALISLEARHLVDRIPNKGAVVARIDTERLLEIYDVFELLEGLTARLAAQNSEPSDWDELVELFGAPLENAIKEDDYEAYFAGVERYRVTAGHIAANLYLMDVLSGIYDQTNTIIRRILIIPGRAHESLLEHRMVLQALQSGDAEGAEQLKRQNMRAARRALDKYRNFLL